MFSEPTFVGILQTDSGGNLVGNLPTPDLDPGIHTLQALGTSQSGNAVVSNVKVELIDTDNVAFTNDEGNDYVAWDFDTDTNYVDDKDYLVQYYYIEDQLGETTLLADTGFNLNYYGIIGIVSFFMGLLLFTRSRKKRLISKVPKSNSMDSLYQNIYVLKTKIEFLVKEKVDVLINFNKVNPYLNKGLYSKNQNEIIDNLNIEVLNLISSVQNIEEKSSKKEIISRTELENILQLIASDKIEFKFNDEILEEDQIKNVAFNSDLITKKTKLKKSNRVFANVLTGVSILLVFSGLLISGYTYNQFYLTNSQQEIAQEKLASIYSGEQNFEKNEEVFASESNFINIGELFNDIPVFDNFIDQALPQENVATEDVEPQIFGYLEISSINVKQYVLEGINENTLKIGPGHYSTTALPGTGGNVGIAGHRTTYGAPFGNLDELNIGDSILLTVDSKTFHYQVDSIDVVQAVGGEYVLFDRGDDRLTLTTCHPKYSAKERLIVSGILTKIEVIS